MTEGGNIEGMGTGVTGGGGAKGANAPSGTFLGVALLGDCFT